MNDYKYNIGETVVINGQKRIITKRYLDHGVAGGVEVSMLNEPPKKYYCLNKRVKIGNYEFGTVEEREIKCAR